MTSPSNPSQFEQLSVLLRWLSNRATSLGAAALCIASLLWVDFRHEFALPVGFADGSVLAALPALVGVTCTCIGMLAGALSFPAQILTAKLHKDGPTLASVFQRSLPEEEKDSSASSIASIRQSLIWRWTFVMLFLGVTWGVCIAWASLNSEVAVWKPLLAFIPAIVLSVFVLRPVAKRVATEKPVSRWYYAGLAQAFGFQAILAFFFLYGILRGATEVDLTDLIERAVYLLMILIFVAMMQLVIVRVIIRGWYPNLFKHLVCVAFAVTIFAASVPPIGARLAGFAFLSSATPRQLCTIFVVRHQATDSPLSPLLADKNKGRTRPMRFVFPFNGSFFVKEKADYPTYILDAKEVTSTESCIDAREDHAMKGEADDKKSGHAAT